MRQDWTSDVQSSHFMQSGISNWGGHKQGAVAEVDVIVEQ